MKINLMIILTLISFAGEAQEPLLPKEELLKITVFSQPIVASVKDGETGKLMAFIDAEDKALNIIHTTCLSKAGKLKEKSLNKELKTCENTFVGLGLVQSVCIMEATGICVTPTQGADDL